MDVELKKALQQEVLAAKARWGDEIKLSKAPSSSPTAPLPIGAPRTTQPTFSLAAPQPHPAVASAGGRRISPRFCRGLRCRTASPQLPLCLLSNPTPGPICLSPPHPYLPFPLLAHAGVCRTIARPASAEAYDVEQVSVQLRIDGPEVRAK
jgi:hypothetical protein